MVKSPGSVVGKMIFVRVVSISFSVVVGGTSSVVVGNSSSVVVGYSSSVGVVGSLSIDVRVFLYIVVGVWSSSEITVVTIGGSVVMAAVIVSARDLVAVTMENKSHQTDTNYGSLIIEILTYL